MDTLEIIRNANRVYIIGNGGSYANAMHICNDLLSVGKPTFTLDPATLTAFANDHGYENVFSIWLGLVGEKGDVLIALSGSGKSRNILNAIYLAERKGMTAIKVFGADLGLDMQEAENDQIRLGHQWMRGLKKA